MPLRDGYSYDTVQNNLYTLINDGIPREQAFAAAYAFGRVSYFRRFPHGALPQWLSYPRKYRLREHYDKSGKPLKIVEYMDNPAKSGIWYVSVSVHKGKYQGMQTIKLKASSHNDAEKKALAWARKKFKTSLIQFKSSGQVAPDQKYTNSRKTHQTAQLFKKFTGRNSREVHQAAQLFKKFTGRNATHMTQHKLPELPEVGLCFGQLVQVGYRSARDGRLYRHTFRERSRPLLVATPDGKMVLIVGGRYAFTDAGIVDK